jgi:hypothetical protein
VRAAENGAIQSPRKTPRNFMEIEPLMVLDEIPEKFLAEGRPAPPKGK